MDLNSYMDLVVIGPIFMPCVIQEFKVNNRKVSSSIEVHALKYLLEMNRIGIKRTAVELIVFIFKMKICNSWTSCNGEGGQVNGPVGLLIRVGMDTWLWGAIWAWNSGHVLSLTLSCDEVTSTSKCSDHDTLCNGSGPELLVQMQSKAAFGPSLCSQLYSLFRQTTYFLLWIILAVPSLQCCAAA